MNFEIIGIFGSIVVLLSFLFNDEKIIRLINMMGAGLLVAYGLCINAFSVCFLNGILIVVHLYKLLKRK